MADFSRAPAGWPVVPRGEADDDTEGSDLAMAVAEVFFFDAAGIVYMCVV